MQLSLYVGNSRRRRDPLPFWLKLRLDTHVPCVFLCRWPRCFFLSFMGASCASLPARREFISRDHSRQRDGCKKNGRGTTTTSQRLRNIDVATNIVRHITQVSCDAYFNEIMSDPVPAPGDEHVAPVLSERWHEQVQQQTVIADFLEPPVPVIESFTPAPVVTFSGPALVIEHVTV